MLWVFCFGQVAGRTTQVLAGQGQKSASGHAGSTSPLSPAPGWLCLLRTLSKTVTDLIIDTLKKIIKYLTLRFC